MKTPNPSRWPFQLQILLPCSLALAVGPLSAAQIQVPAHHTTIQAAVQAAGPGDVVIVDPGRYAEVIHLNPGVTLLAKGQARETIIDPGGEAPAVVMADRSVIRGFTVTGAGRFDQAAFDRHHAERGENLPDNQGAVGVEGSTAAILIERVTATVADCIVHDNGHAGIGVSGAGNRSIIRSNLVHRNMGAGIGIANGAEPLVTGNDCHHNLRAGIGCRASSPLIDGNRCHHNVRAGIGVREGATPVVINNECHDNQRAGIGVRMPGTEPRLHFNRCHDNGLAGIGCRDGAAPLIFQNECWNNRLAGIGAMSDSRPWIEGNRIHGNGGAAIGFDPCGNGEAVVRDNEITGHHAVCLGINRGWQVRVETNRIRRDGGMPPLVMVFAGARAAFTGNTLTGSGVAAIRTAGRSFISANTFHCPTPRNSPAPPQSAIWSLEGAATAVSDDNTNQGWGWSTPPPLRVRNRPELAAALRDAGPGTTILLEPGTYAGGFPAQLHGTPDRPIVLAGARADRMPVLSGGNAGIHLSGGTHIELRNLIIEGATGNGLNIDDGGRPDSPAQDITLSGLVIRNIGPRGNRDGIKLSGVRDFRIEHCRIERWGDSGSGIDMVGCHDGVISDSSLTHPGAESANGVQAKGGSSNVLVRRCRFENAGGRSINLGGSTGAGYFRPLNAGHEARNLTVEDCTFTGSSAPVAFVGVDGALVRHNSIERPSRWIVRILQENQDPRLAPCRNGRFNRNLVVFRSSELRTAVNVGSGTAPNTFQFEGNAWLCEDRPEDTPRLIQLPVEELNGAWGNAARRERRWTAGVRMAMEPD